MSTEENLIAQRLKKLEEIKSLGIEPYPYNFDQKNHTKDILEKHSKLKAEEKTSDEASIAGRIMSIRGMGKASFGHLQDVSGKIQFYIKQDTVGEKAYKLFKLLDLGDIVGIKGKIFKTKTGEVSIWVEELELLCKALYPLPEKWHGLRDTEIRYRMRHVDLIVNPEVKEKFIIKSKIINAIREYLISQGYIEVETPILQPIYGGGFAKPFTTHHNELNITMYLRISNEMYLKRLIAGGFEKVFEFSTDFRNEGIDSTHNPEFLQVEMMTAYKDYMYGMELIEETIKYAVQKILKKTKVEYQGKIFDFSKWEKLTVNESIKKHLNLDVEKIEDKELISYAQKNKVDLSKGKRRGEVINAIYEELVQLKLIQPTIIYDYPKEVSALARDHRKNPKITERFEMFVNGMEVGNNYTEISDPIVLETRFKEELKRGDEETHPMDKDFLLAMKYGMPPTCGTAIGVDRLVMLLTDSPSIKEIIPFPFMRPENLEENKTGKAEETNIAVAIINKELKLKKWEELNTVAHLNAAFGARMGKQLLLQDKIKTKDNKEINLNIQHAIMIKEADSNKEIIKIIKQAKEQGLEVAEFTREMIETTDDKKVISITQNKNLKEIEYLGVLVFGKKSDVEKITKDLKLHEQ